MKNKEIKTISFLTRLLAILMCVVLPLLFCGCEKEEETQVSFDELSVILLEFDSKVRPFLSTLQLNYNFDADIELLNSAVTTITTLSSEMGESFKAFNSVLSELENNSLQGTTVTKTSESITIVSDGLEFTVRLLASKTSMSITSKKGSQEQVFEISSRESGGYYAQVVIKNSNLEYSVYQLAFFGASGSLNLDLSASGYISIYGAQINDSAFPNVSAKQFSA